ncbi:hypothetical protein [Streptomyces sp. NPDC090021]|uniref:hypothetical protein n=1 Tax=Streptomyces sp. NPDC090021 TaxID=3365919 RepID=UPI00381A3273
MADEAGPATRGITHRVHHPRESGITHERHNTDRIPIHHIRESGIIPLCLNFIEKPAREIPTSNLTEPDMHENPELRTNFRIPSKNPLSPNRGVTILYQHPNERRHAFAIGAKHKKCLATDTAPPPGCTPAS